MIGSKQQELQNITLSHQAMDRAVSIAKEWVENLPARHINANATPEQMRALLDEPLPNDGMAPDEAISDWMQRAEPGIVPSSGPRYFAFVVGGSLPAAIGGDWLASTIDQNARVWSMSPAAAQTELVVVRWLKELFGLPADWSGVVTSGATMSSLVGLAAARQWASGLLGFNAAEDGLGGHPAIPVISGASIHPSIRKALGNLGFGRLSVQIIPSPNGQVDIDALATAVAAQSGPVIVIGNAGEVTTGQFDDLQAIAEICRSHPGGAWMHVDGAFGLYAAASSSHKHLVDGIEHADSVGADGHKWLNVPYDSGFAFVRDESALRGAFATSKPTYLATNAGWNADDFSAEMSRRFRALPAWCALRSLGKSGFQELIDRCLDNALKLCEWVETKPWVELMNRERMLEQPFSNVCIRFTSPEWNDEEHNEKNLQMLRLLQEDGRVFASGHEWTGRTTIRFSFDNWMTTDEDVEMIFTVLEDLRRKHATA